MVKVSMRKAERILLMASILVLSLGTANASLWHRTKKAEAPAQQPAAAAAAAMSLDAIEVDGGRVMLRTSGTPAYTSYSPSPTVFVVDLAGTAKGASVTIPQALPSGVSSLTAEEVTEMGSRLTRVTFRITDAQLPQVSPSDKTLVINLPASATAIAAAPAVTAPPVEQHAEVKSEPAPEPVHIAPVEVAAAPSPVPAQKARTIKSIEATGSGDALQIRIHGDGAMAYKAFELANPARLVIDIAGVHDAVKKSTITVNDATVKGVRVAQFKGGADAVTRVVVDLNAKSEYNVVPDGSALRVMFGSGATAAKEQPVTIAETTIKPAVPAKSIDEVPAVAENATWKMPESAAKGAKVVINSPDQAAPPTPRPRTPAAPTPAVSTNTTTPGQVNGENVFTEPATGDQSTSARGQTLTGTMPSRTLSPGQRIYTGDPISLNLKDADIKDVLRTFAQLTGLNIAVDPQVNGTVTVDFVDVPWDQALDLILRQNGLTYVLEGNVMRVGTIDRISAETAATRRLAEEERLNVPLQTVIFKLSYARAADVQGLLRDLASPRARIIVDTRTNQLIISEIPQFLQTMRNLIDTVDVPTRQVVIEARIVEATKQFAQSYGVDWGFNGAFDPAFGNGTGLIFPNRVGFTGGPFNFGGPGPVLALHMTDVLGTFNLDIALNAFENEQLAKVVSAPRVTTQDNQPAEIQSGVQIPYQTRVNFTTTVTYIDATLRLSVTPQITEAGTIIMEIAVQKTTPGAAIEGAAGVPLNTRQARTRLMVRDGGTAVIGGIYQVTDTTNQTRVPFLHQIPIVGNLFKTHSINSTHDELLIFITPRIVRGS
jgi:type IV pilus secretin PilQ/predicted competence protein